MAKVIQLERKRKPAAESPLTPELQEFIDRAIVPILVKQYLAMEGAPTELAERGAVVAKSLRKTAALSGQVRP